MAPSGNSGDIPTPVTDMEHRQLPVHVDAGRDDVEISEAGDGPSVFPGKVS